MSNIIITRTFPASPERVFATWTDPEDFAVWFGGADVDVPVESVSLDVHKGGKWHAIMYLPDGDPIDWHGEYTDVTPPSHLAMTMSDDPDVDSDDPIVVQFAESGTGTQMTMTQPRGDFSADQVAATTKGWNGFFDALETLVAPPVEEDDSASEADTE